MVLASEYNCHCLGKPAFVERNDPRTPSWDVNIKTFQQSSGVRMVTVNIILNTNLDICKSGVFIQSLLA